ncbi:MAG: WbuC family cupin fold metalloprotein [Bacteroidales bacterium]|nr:WbuC family cupin fold metalloprotein [Bacteroidales bacterium]
MKIINQQIINDTCEKAYLSERKRMNYNIHETLDEDLHKMINAFQPETKIPVHRHLHPSRKETYILIQGKLDIVRYNEEGYITSRSELSKESGNIIAEMLPGDWHTLDIKKPDTVIVEIKKGPYIPFPEIDLLDVKERV